MEPVIERTEGALTIVDESGDQLIVREGKDNRFNWPFPRLEVSTLDDTEGVHLDVERVEALRDFCDEFLAEHGR